MKLFFAFFVLLFVSFTSFAQSRKVWVGVVRDEDKPRLYYDTFSIGAQRSLVVTDFVPEKYFKGSYVSINPNQEIVYTEKPDFQYTDVLTEGHHSIVLVDKNKVNLLFSGKAYIHPIHPKLRTISFHFAQEKLTLNNKSVLSIDYGYLDTQLSILSGTKNTADNVKLTTRSTSQGRKNTLQYLKKEFESLGLIATEKPYSRGSNLEATIKGRENKTLLFTAHYDSATNSATDDNGTGVAALLSIAKSLKASGIIPKYNLTFVALDQEEIGLVGSEAYASSLSASDVIADINTDMLGYDGNKDFVMHIIDCDRSDSMYITELFIQLIADLKLPLKNNKSCTDRSDHASFWDVGISAVVLAENFFGGDENPCYHQKCDTEAKLNKDFYHNIVNLITQFAYRVN